MAHARFQEVTYTRRFYITVFAISMIMFVGLCFGAYKLSTAPAADGTKHTYVMCFDTFGEVIYEGAADEAFASDSFLRVREPSGVRAVFTNIPCFFVTGTSAQIRQSFQDHGYTSEDPPDDSF